MVIERVLVRLFYRRPPEDQILVTFGVGIVLVEAIRAIFGGNNQRVPVPSWGEGVTQLGFLIYPTYRLELIGIIALILGLLWLVLYRTSIGLVVRAGYRGRRHGRHPGHQRPPHLPAGVRVGRGRRRHSPACCMGRSSR